MRSVMSRYYNKRSYKSPARRAAAMKRDMCRQNKPEHVFQNNSPGAARWARNPRKYDLEGFDDGSMCEPGHKVQRYVRRAASPKQAAALARGRAKRQANVAARKAQRGGADGCGFNSASLRCNKGLKENEEWCQMGKKNRCVKSPLGRKMAPKRKASAKQLAGLAKGRATRKANLAARHHAA